jgi:hypothetical protein
VFPSVDVQITNLARPFHRMLDRNPQAGRRIGMVSEDAEHGGALCAGSGSEMHFGQATDLRDLCSI